MAHHGNHCSTTFDNNLSGLCYNSRMELQVKTIELPNKACVILPDGSIDFTTAKEFDRLAEALIKKTPPAVLLDMVEVKYLSSVGLSSIIQLMKKCKDKNIALALYDPQTPVQRVLEISRLTILELKLAQTEPTHPFYDYLHATEPGRQEKRLEREKAKQKKSEPVKKSLFKRK